MSKLQLELIQKESKLGMKRKDDIVQQGMIQIETEQSNDQSKQVCIRSWL